MTERKPILIVTGMSGAGKTISLKVLEDLGYRVTDNLPVPMIGRLVELSHKEASAIALGIDVRTVEFESNVIWTELDVLKSNPDYDVQILFLDADDDVLTLRFNESRRAHPLGEEVPLEASIQKERLLLEEFQKRCDLHLDTTHLKTPDFKRILGHHYRLKTLSLTLTVMSFSYRVGLPREADYVFDMRFLDNPYYDQDLKHQSGLDQGVQEKVALDQNFGRFLGYVSGMMDTVLPEFEQEGRHSVTLAFGCTGGRHRSVSSAEWAYKHLSERYPEIHILHRDLPSKP